VAKQWEQFVAIALGRTQRAEQRIELPRGTAFSRCRRARAAGGYTAISGAVCRQPAGSEHRGGVRCACDGWTGGRCGWI